jgi:hypothetical protein
MQVQKQWESKKVRYSDLAIGAQHQALATWKL